MMGKAIDMTGMKYNKLTCLQKLEERDNGHIQFLFECECGTVIKARGGDVRQGKTKSCGCHKLEYIKEVNKGKNNEQRRLAKIERMKNK